MKARYAKTFEYGREMAKTAVICAVVCCIVGVLFFQTGSIAQIIAIAMSFLLAIATVVIMYVYCRCPYCGKHIMMGVLSVKSCPACRRNLESGKKVKK